MNGAGRRGESAASRGRRLRQALGAALLCLCCLPFLSPSGFARARGEGERSFVLRLRLTAEDGAERAYVGVRQRKTSALRLKPASVCRAEDGSEWNPAALAREGRILRVVWRFRAEETQTRTNRFTLRTTEGEEAAASGTVLDGWNLWDVTGAFASLLSDTGTLPTLTMEPADHGARRGTVVLPADSRLYISMTVREDAPGPAAERITDSALLDAALSALPADHPVLRRYQEVGGSLVQALWDTGVPYYFGGHSEEKVLRRLYPLQGSRYYREDRLYLCGFDCASYLHWVEEKAGFAPHDSLQAVLRQRENGWTPPAEVRTWWMYLQPGDMLAVEHGSFHVLMYIGTPRQYGWTEESAPEWRDWLDAPLLIHCGEDPFVTDRFEQYIDAHRDEWNMIPYPPDGGVTVSLGVPDKKDALHLREASWGTEYGYWTVEGLGIRAFPTATNGSVVWFRPEEAE